MNKILFVWAIALMIGGTSLANVEIARLQSDQIEQPLWDQPEQVLPFLQTTPRSKARYREFRHHYACPSTGLLNGACPGYVVDHKIALCDGGDDYWTNMQWQTVEEAKIKDRSECNSHRRQGELKVTLPPVVCLTPEGKEESCAQRNWK